MYKDTDVHHVEHLLESFLQKGYDFVRFDQLNKPKKQIALRHDIDFDLDATLKMALTEQRLGIKASYFFLVTNDSYNLFSRENVDIVLKIKEMGHTVSVHFDPTIYSDFEEGFRKEKKCFELFFDIPVDIISLHRPNAFFQEYDQPFLNCEHTYMKKYFKDMKYISDSTGLFRFGHPLESEEFRNNDSIHLLLHPIWWFFEGEKNTEKLTSFYNFRKEQLKQHYAANCKPFKEIINEIG